MKSLFTTLALLASVVALLGLALMALLFVGEGDEGKTSQDELAPAASSLKSESERETTVLATGSFADPVEKPSAPSSGSFEAAIREDATDREAWRLIADLSGFTELVSDPVELEVSALGSDKTIRFSTDANGRYSFDLSPISRAHPFDPPSINVLVDHDEFFLWDETIDGVRENGEVVFRATIELQPFRARLSGRVVVPSDHEPLPYVAAFVSNDRGRPGRKPITVAQCAGDHTFELWVEDPSLMFLVAASPGVRPDTVQLNIQPGSSQDDLQLTLLPGYSISGWVKLEGEPLRETQQLFASYKPPAEKDEGATDPEALLAPSILRTGREGSTQFFTVRLSNAMTIHYVEDIALVFRHSRFFAHGATATIQADGAFSITGLDRATYELSVTNEGSPTSPFDYQTVLGSFKAPAQGIFINYESIAVTLEFRVDGVIEPDVRHSISLDSKLDRFNSLQRMSQDKVRIRRGSTATVTLWGNSYEEQSIEIDPEQADAEGVLVVELTRRETP